MAAFHDAFVRLRQDFDQAQDKRRKLIEDIRTEVREKAQQTGNELAEKATARREEFAAMIHDLRGEIRAEADKTRGELAALAEDLRQGGRVFSRR